MCWYLVLSLLSVLLLGFCCLLWVLGDGMEFLGRKFFWEPARPLRFSGKCVSSYCKLTLRNGNSLGWWCLEIPQEGGVPQDLLKPLEMDMRSHKSLWWNWGLRFGWGSGEVKSCSWPNCILVRSLHFFHSVYHSLICDIHSFDFLSLSLS